MKSQHITLQSPTPNLERTNEFYTKLQFTNIGNSEQPIYSDGKLTIEINKDHRARPGIVLYTEDTNVVENLKSKFSLFKAPTEHICMSPSGTWVHIRKSSDSLNSAENIAASLLGNSMGISLETLDISKSVLFWSMFGFKVTMGDEKSGWVVLSDEYSNAISLMSAHACPHSFTNPSVSFFNGPRNTAIIQGIKDAGIDIYEEVTVFNPEQKADNVIIRDPGGIGFFVYNDGE